MSENDLEPLPDELEKEIAAFRRVTPPTDLLARSFAALPTPKREMASNAKQDGQTSFARLFGLRVAPVLVAAAAAGYLLFGRPSANSEFDISSERAVRLPEQGHAWTDIELQTHHHADHPAVVHVEVPTHVSVRFASENGQTAEKSCTAERCVHRFTHHARNGMPLRVAVAHPGRYEIHVRHESEKARLREKFVLLAGR